MIMADTSVWIDHFRSNQTTSTQRLTDPANAPLLMVGDIILAELLQGAKDEKHANQIEAILRNFQIANLVNDTMAVKAARNYRLMRSNGFTMNKIADLFIGTYCIEYNLNLLHSDKDYDVMEQVCGLRVLR